MHIHSRHGQHRSREAHMFAVAVAVWFMVAGACVVVANTWAMGF